MIPLFNKLNDTVEVVPVKNGLCFIWTRQGIGFGELTFIIRDDKFIVDNENMSPDFCAEVVKQAIIEALERQEEEEKNEHVP